MRSSRVFAIVTTGLFAGCSGSTGGDGGSGGSTATGGGVQATGGGGAAGGLATGGGTVAAGGGTATGGGSAAMGGGTGGGGTPTFDGGTLRPYVFVGAVNNVHVYTLEPGDGGLTPIGSYPTGTTSSFLAMSESRRFAYVLNEGGATVASFAVGDAGRLDFINRVDAGGTGPAHVSIDHTGQYVLVANYGGGTVAVMPILDGGALGNVISNPAPGPMAHMIIDVGGNIYVPVLGADRVAFYDLNAGHLVPKTPPFVSTDAGAGPRHLAFHPNGQWAYLMNETNSTVNAYDVNAGVLSFKHTYSSLPAGFTGANTGAEIFVHPDGHSVYASNRGNDSIVHFHIEADGLLTLVGHTPTGGAQPRNFGIAPDGTLLLVANQTGNNIIAMRIEPVSGNLTSLGEVAQLQAPEYVGIVYLP